MQLRSSWLAPFSSALVFLLSGLFGSQAAAETFYIDATSGNNSRAGTSESSAWQTLARVSAEPLRPDDTVLFKRNETWSGQLTVLWSGSSDYPITLGAYGVGDEPHTIDSSVGA